MRKLKYFRIESSKFPEFYTAPTKNFWFYDKKNWVAVRHLFDSFLCERYLKIETFLSSSNNCVILK